METKECEHAGCVCTVAMGRKFCSVRCETAFKRGEEMKVCDCGHEDCS